MPQGCEGWGEWSVDPPLEPKVWKGLAFSLPLSNLRALGLQGLSVSCG